MSDRIHSAGAVPIDDGGDAWADAPGGAGMQMVGAGIALREFCLQQVEYVGAMLQRDARRHRGVHEARKGIRRLRSALALGAPCLGAEAHVIDRILQRLGRSLSALRDAHVAVERVRRQAREATATQRGVWRGALELLVRARARELRRALRRDPEFARRRKRLARCAPAIAALPWHRLGTPLLSAQLTRGRERADRAAARFGKSASLARLHGLRKRLRRHRMQIVTLAALLTPAGHAPVRAPPAFRASVTAYAATLDEIERQVDALGARLDARLLHGALRRLPHSRERKAALALLERDAPG